MGTASLALRICVLILCALAIFLPWIWEKCILAMTSLSAMGLGIVGVTVAAMMIATEGGDEMHCKVVEGVIGCLLVIAGVLQIQYDQSDCNVLVLLVFLVVAGVLFIVDMVLVILGK